MNFKKLIRNKKLAFTLAEVVVVMAILGVMMAAFAPVVTKRTLTASGNNKITFDTIADHNGIYYGTTEDQKTVLIGDIAIANTSAFDPRLLLISNSFSEAGGSAIMTPQIGFGAKVGENTVSYNGQLLMDPSFSSTAPEDKGSLILGGIYNANYRPNSESSYGNTIIGMNAGPAVEKNVKNITVIGTKACEGNIGNNVICIGALSGSEAELADSNKIYIGTRTEEYKAKDINFGNKTLEEIIVSYIPVTPSDIRLKNVGKEFKGGLNELNQLTFYHYTYKRDSEKTPRVGVMAQDLQKVFPDAVSENKDGYLYIRKDDMFYAALNAIKDLFKQITDNTEKVKALEERNALLEKQVKELQELYIDLAKKVDKKAAKKQLTITPEKPVTEEVPEEVLPEQPQE